MRYSRGSRLLAVMGVLLLVAAGCSSDDSEDSSEASTSAPQASDAPDTTTGGSDEAPDDTDAATSAPVTSDEPILYGFLDALSGPAAVFGEARLNGLTMAVEEVGDGMLLGRQVEIVSEDGAADPSTTSAAAQRLLGEEKVDVISGSTGSSAALAIAEAATEYDVIHLNAISTIEGSTVCNPHMFHLFQDNVATIRSIAPYAAREIGSNWYQLQDQTEPGEIWAESFDRIITDEGGAVSQTTLISAGSVTDYSEQISQMRADDVDAVGIFLVRSSPVTIRKQMDALAFDKPVIDVSLVPEQVRGAGPGVFTDDTTAIWWSPDVSEEAREWAERFAARFGELPSPLAAAEYLAYQLWHTAVENAGTTDYEAVRQELVGVSVDTPLVVGGTATIRAEDQQLIAGMMITRVTDDMDQPFENIEEVASEDIFPDSTWQDAGCDLTTQ